MNGEALWWPDLAAAAPGAVTVPPPDTPADTPSESDPHLARIAALMAAQTGGTVFTLSRGEQLLLWSARRWRHGRFRWDEVELEFRRRLPGGWADALLAWEEALEQLHQYPTGRPDIGNGCRTALSVDERALLTILAVLQRPRSARLSPGLLLARLLPPARRRDLLAPLLAVATGLSLGGVELPLRGPCPFRDPSPDYPYP